MRVVNGKRVRQMDAREVATWAAAQQAITIDLGTGDGRFVRDLAARRPGHGVIGVDLCTANMAATSRRSGGNALFVVADALALPEELGQIAHRVSIQFPWGSLRRGLLDGHPGLFAGLHAVSRPGAIVEIVVNAGALAEAGWAFEDGWARIEAVLRDAGLAIRASAALGPPALRRCPSTWARRLAFGRDPRAVRLAARLPGIRDGFATSARRGLCYSCRLAGSVPAQLRLCEPFCSVGQVSAQPHQSASGASPQEGGLVARSRTRAPQV